MGLSLKNHFPILDLKLRKGPFVLMKMSDRHLELIEARRILGKFFITKEGCFELDGEYAYRLYGMGLYFYNLHNSKPLSLAAIEEIQKLYREHNISILVDELEKVNTAISESKTLGTSKILKLLGEKRTLSENDLSNPAKIKLVAQEFAEENHTVTQETAKFLIEQKLYDDKDTTLLLADSMLAKKALEVISPTVGTNVPLLIFAAIGIAFVAIMTQLPNYIHFF
jgi:hypothetical protein